MEHYFTNNQNLKSELRDINFSFDAYNFTFKSDNGVFSKNKIDYASLFLVKTFFASNKKEINSILDAGCGYGFIGITLSKILNKHIDMVDINKRAVHLCEMNIKQNKVDATVWESNVYEKVDNKYDLIITNPPIRAGKSVLMDFLKGGLARLNKDGELWFVISKDQGAKSVKKELEKICTVNIIDKSKGFYVFSTKI
ncbi:MAG: class I SAM-dependent methyltransferase [Clostridia bacterium]|nr:class I SAM-dependent methyltransferase [Clostridia bacterium]